MLSTLVSTALTASLLLTPVYGEDVFVAGQAGQLRENPRILASETMDLASRYPVESISDGFEENILIALRYLALQDDVLQSYSNFTLTLKPGEVFAFHRKGILAEFKESKIISQESDFTTDYGYKVVAGLGGNGVCHLASLINKVGREAGLKVVAPTSHNFAAIPGVELEYGTSISTRSSPEKQNLYIKNNFDFPVRLLFSLNENQLSFSIIQ